MRTPGALLQTSSPFYLYVLQVLCGMVQDLLQVLRHLPQLGPRRNASPPLTRLKNRHILSRDIEVLITVNCGYYACVKSMCLQYKHKGMSKCHYFQTNSFQYFSNKRKIKYTLRYFSPSLSQQEKNAMFMISPYLLRMNTLRLQSYKH